MERTVRRLRITESVSLSIAGFRAWFERRIPATMNQSHGGVEKSALPAYRDANIPRCISRIRFAEV